MISRCDSAAIVPNTRELLPEPETPVNTVSQRFGISTLMSLRLFTRAPRTRINSWLVVLALLIVSPSVRRRRLARSNQLPAGAVAVYLTAARRPPRHLVAYGSANRYRPVNSSRASGSSGT